MKATRTSLLRGATVVALIGCLGAVSVPALSQPMSSAPAATVDPATRQARFHEHVQKRLERMAQRLQLTADQQPAWNAYRQTVEGLVGSTDVTKPSADADAATITRFRAQRAVEHAQKLTQLADATAALQQALTPEQQAILNEMTRRPAHDRHGKRGGAH